MVQFAGQNPSQFGLTHTAGPHEKKAAYRSFTASYTGTVPTDSTSYRLYSFVPERIMTLSAMLLDLLESFLHQGPHWAEVASLDSQRVPALVQRLAGRDPDPERVRSQRLAAVR
jgi:hypothetical protein